MRNCGGTIHFSVTDMIRPHGDQRPPPRVIRGAHPEPTFLAHRDRTLETRAITSHVQSRAVMMRIKFPCQLSVPDACAVRRVKQSSKFD